MADESDEWDMDYLTEVHWSKMPQDTGHITAIGRGRGKLKTDVTKLTLPQKAFASSSKGNEAEGRSGRGRVRGRGEEMKARALMKTGPARMPRERPGHRPSELTSIASFPPLGAPGKTNSSPKNSPSFPKRIKNSSSQSKKNFVSDSEASWPSLHKATTSKKTLTKETSQSNETFAGRCKPSNDSNVQTSQGLAASDGNDIIIIKNLPKTIQEKDLIDLLQLYGTVLVCDIERDGNGESLGTALVRMESSTECEWIISCYHDQEYPGSSEKLMCKFLGE